MDLHPAPIPVAKRRVAEKPTLKSVMAGPNAKKEKPTQLLAPVKPRPKRAFGVSRNTNIPVEKAQLKKNKPASGTANLAKRTGTTTENAKLTPTERKKRLQTIHLKEDKEKKKDEATQTSATDNLTKRTGTATENAKLSSTERKKQLQEIHLKEDKDKKKDEATQTSATANLTKRTETTTENAKLTPTERKKQLQKIHLEGMEKKKEEAAQNSATANLSKRTETTTENAELTPTERKKQLQKIHLKDDKEKKKEEAMWTPLTVTRKVTDNGTPYFSALNCSNCRVDRLETTSYWLNQIKLSEAVGKHFVSAAFFRLALECHAQPLEKILSELKNYSKRHQTTSTISLFDDLLQSYGLPVVKSKSEHASILISEPNKASLLSDSHKDEPEETTVSCECKIEKFTLEKEHDCNSNQGSHPDISPEQPENEPKQGEVVKPEHLEIKNPTGEVNNKLKPDIQKDHDNSASDKGTGQKLTKSPPTRGALSSKKTTTCLEKSSLIKKDENGANELNKSIDRQEAKNEKTECISKSKDEVVSLTDSVMT